MEGAWSVAPPADFRIAFNGASVTDGTHWTPVDRYTSIAFSNASNSVVISFAAPIVLCPGCTLSGPGGDPIFTLAHKDSLTLDHQSLSVGDISCGSKAVQVPSAAARRSRALPSGPPLRPARIEPLRPPPQGGGCDGLRPGGDAHASRGG